MEEQLTTVETAMQLGLLIEEFEKIKGLLGRTPNFTELSAFSVMWSEHCCYKSSILWLKKLPKSSPRMLAEAGEENAGLVDIGNGLACAFKIESHNHPSAIEPYQGAATGVGGINRDIFTMGARPIAQLNTLRFGDISLEKTKHLLRGVVKGIGDYGNAFGVPTVGGEIYFNDSYNTNPLVNAFSAGIVETDKVASAISYGVGNPVFIVGSATGKDGIHGAAFASKDITEESANDLPSVQVGDPFQEKLLLEATLEIIASGHVVGVQDMGAAGIICSSAEMSAKGEHGMDIDLDKVPLRQANMLPFEILLSESQERMLVVIEKGKEQAILDIFDKWDLNCAEIGVVTDSKHVRFFQKGEVVADMPANSLVLGGDTPIYEHSYTEPDYFQKYKQFKTEDIAEPADYAAVAKFLMTHPNIVSRRWVYEQYDSMVGTANASTNSPADAAVVHVKGSDQALVMTVDCNGRYVQADPKIGAMIAVCESARNVVCAGGDPVAITNNLNFGNPYNQEVYWQFVQSVKGIIEACEKLETPVTGGNVSFYNQASTVSKEGGNVTNAVYPTPTIGMLGLMDNLDNRMTLDFKNVGDLIFMLGEPKNDIAGSEYVSSFHNFHESSAPHFDLEAEHDLQQTVKALIRDKQIQSAHDISDGGLFVTLAESAMPRGLGFSILTTFNEIDVRKDAFLFGEAQSRVTVTIKAEDQDRFEGFMKEQSVPYFEVGVVTVSDFKVDTQVLMTTEEATDLYDNTLGRHMDGEAVEA